MHRSSSQPAVSHSAPSQQPQSILLKPRGKVPVQLYSMDILLPGNRAVPHRSALILMVTGHLGISLSQIFGETCQRYPSEKYSEKGRCVQRTSSGLKAKQVLAKAGSDEVKPSNDGPSSRKENRDTDVPKFNSAAILRFGFHYCFTCFMGFSALRSFNCYTSHF